jgi:hypothetical protein
MRTYWKIVATQGSQTIRRTVYDVYDAVMVPAQLEQEGYHVTCTEHKDGGARETYQTENDAIQAGLDLCMKKLDARDAAGVPWVGF